MNQKAQTAVISMEDIVASSVNNRIFLQTSDGKPLGSATVTILDGGYSHLVEINYEGRRSIVQTGKGEYTARKMAFDFYNAQHNNQ